MRNLAIIPARSGSKGLKDKNIKNLNGKPLIAYSIESAEQSKLFNEIVVSTDSEEYSTIAKKYGAKVPYLRSVELASDTAVIWKTVLEIVNHYKSEGIFFDTVMLLQPTSPLRSAEDIINAYDLMYEKEAKIVVGVCEADHSPLWMNILSDDGSLKNFINKEISCKARQSLPTHYRVNGAIYLMKTSEIVEKMSLYDEDSYALIMPKNRSVDIDDKLDFSLAEVLLDQE